MLGYPWIVLFPHLRQAYMYWQASAYTGRVACIQLICTNIHIYKCHVYINTSSLFVHSVLHTICKIVNIYTTYIINYQYTIPHKLLRITFTYGFLPKCLLPKMIVSYVLMGARCLFYSLAISGSYWMENN